MKDKIKTLEKRKNLKLIKVLRRQKLQEKGITLIALVVTIIILLILAGVTLNIALSDNGLFSKAKEATDRYKQAQNEEAESIRQISTQMYSDYVGAKVEGYTKSIPEGKTTTISTTESGHTAEQIFTTDTTMEWRVWDYDGNTLRIIGDPTKQKLTLQGATGYNNGVLAIEQICNELYSNGKEGVNVTNLKRTDIQKVSTYDYTKYKHQSKTWEEDKNTDDTNSIYYGATKPYDNTQYPTMWEKDKEWQYEYKNGKITGEDKEGKIWEINEKDEDQVNSNIGSESGKMEFKQSYYSHNYDENEFINNSYYNLIFKKSDGKSSTGAYWLAGRYVHLYDTYCTFGIQRINAGTNTNGIGGPSMFKSDRYTR